MCAQLIGLIFSKKVHFGLHTRVKMKKTENQKKKLVMWSRRTSPLLYWWCYIKTYKTHMLFLIYFKMCAILNHFCSLSLCARYVFVVCAHKQTKRHQPNQVFLKFSAPFSKIKAIPLQLLNETGDCALLVNFDIRDISSVFIFVRRYLLRSVGFHVGPSKKHERKKKPQDKYARKVKYIAKHTTSKRSSCVSTLFTLKHLRLLHIHQTPVVQAAVNDPIICQNASARARPEPKRKKRPKKRHTQNEYNQYLISVKFV